MKTGWASRVTVGVRIASIVASKGGASCLVRLFDAVCELQPVLRVPAAHLDRAEGPLDVRGDRGGVAPDLEPPEGGGGVAELDPGVEDPGGVEALLGLAEEFDDLRAVDPSQPLGPEPTIPMLPARHPAQFDHPAVHVVVESVER